MFLLAAIERLEGAGRLLEAVQNAGGDPLVPVRELDAYRNVIATIRAIKASGRGVPVEDFEAFFLDRLSQIYGDMEEALGDSASLGAPPILFHNPRMALQLRPMMLASLVNFIAFLRGFALGAESNAIGDPAWSGATRCAVAVHLTSQIRQWLARQPSVGEESLTDWFLYRFSAALPRVRYLKFTRRAEGATTGADWEWWFVGDTHSLGIRVQAKNLAGTADAYPLLAYANRHGLQIEMLLKSAATQNLLPLFVLYHDEVGSLSTLCPDASSHPSGLPMAVRVADAQHCYDHFVRPGRLTLAPATILAEAVPLSCLFCCGAQLAEPGASVEQLVRYIGKAFRPSASVDRDRAEIPGVRQTPPAYVSRLLGSSEAERPIWIEAEYSSHFREIDSLFVVDLREGR